MSRITRRRLVNRSDGGPLIGRAGTSIGQAVWDRSIVGGVREEEEESQPSSTPSISIWIDRLTYSTNPYTLNQSRTARAGAEAGAEQPRQQEPAMALGLGLHGGGDRRRRAWGEFLISFYLWSTMQWSAWWRRARWQLTPAWTQRQGHPPCPPQRRREGGEGGVRIPATPQRGIQRLCHEQGLGAAPPLFPASRSKARWCDVRELPLKSEPVCRFCR